MIIVLDTTAFTGDANFGGSFWRIIEARPERWALRIVCPWPVVEEAIGNRRAALQTALSQLRTRIQNGVEAARNLAVSTEGIDLYPLVDALNQAKSDSEAWFTERLEQLRIEVLPIDHLSHRDAVRRAVARTRPCNDKGDGYRDTLNWLSVLDVAASTDEEVIWVSSNSTDFMDPQSTADAPKFHPHLEADLTERDLAEQVRYCTSIGQVQQHIVEVHQIHEDPRWASFELQVSAAVVAELVSDLTSWSLDPISCGLPISVRGAPALLSGAEHIKSASVENLDDTDVLPFRAPFEATCALQTVRGADGQSVDAVAPDGSPMVVKKELVAVGTVRVDRTTSTTQYVIIDGITGHDDDSDVIANRDAARRFAEVAATIATIYNEQLTSLYPAVDLGNIAANTALLQPYDDLAKMTAALMKPHYDIAKASAALMKPHEDLAKMTAALMKPHEDIAKASAALMKPHEDLAALSAAVMKPYGDLAKAATATVSTPIVDAEPLLADSETDDEESSST